MKLLIYSQKSSEIFSFFVIRLLTWSLRTIKVSFFASSYTLARVGSFFIRNETRLWTSLMDVILF